MSISGDHFILPYKSERRGMKVIKYEQQYSTDWDKQSAYYGTAGYALVEIITGAYGNGYENTRDTNVSEEEWVGLLRLARIAEQCV